MSADPFAVRISFHPGTNLLFFVAVVILLLGFSQYVHTLTSPLPSSNLLASTSWFRRGLNACCNDYVWEDEEEEGEDEDAATLNLPKGLDRNTLAFGRACISPHPSVRTLFFSVTLL